MRYINPRLTLTLTLITMQSLLVVSHTVCAHIGGPPPQKKNGGRTLGPRPKDGGVSDALETGYFQTCITTPNLHTPGQAVWAYLWKSARNFLPSIPAFQGRSRSSEPTPIDRITTTS